MKNNKPSIIQLSNGNYIYDGEEFGFAPHSKGQTHNDENNNWPLF